MSTADQQLLSAYLDGRQSEEESAAFEARLAVEPALTRRWAELLLMDLELRSALAATHRKSAATRRKSASTWFGNRFTRAALFSGALIAAALLVSLSIWAWPPRTGHLDMITIEVLAEAEHDVTVDGGPMQRREVHAGQTVRTLVPLTLRWQSEATTVIVTPISGQPPGQLAGQAVVHILDRGLALDAGMLEAEVAPRDRDHSFQIVAGEALATVVGTHFRITRDTHETALQVMSGRVEFRHHDQVQVVGSGGTATTLGDLGTPKKKAPDRGLIAHWSGESLVGNRLDNLAKGGQVGEAWGVRAVPGHQGQALRFSGVESLTAIPHTPAGDVGDPAKPFTIAVWLRLEKDDRRDQTVVGKGRNLTTPGPTLAVVLEVSAGDHVDLYRWHDAEPHADRKMEVSGWTVPHLADGAWHHVVVVAEHASLRRCYYDGVEVGTDTRTWLHETRNLSRWTIGRLENMGFTEEYPFTGDLQDLRIYDRAVTPDEVTALFSAAP